MDVRNLGQRLGWALPWLLFLGFPLADLASTPRPVGVQVLAGAGLLVFTIAYLRVFLGIYTPCGARAGRELAVLAVLGTALPLWLGPTWAGLLIYVSASAAGSLSERHVWPAVLAATTVCAAVVGWHGLLSDLFILPLMCLLTAFAIRGTRQLLTVNAELAEAREELARHAVAEERLRFARDLHDLLGHSLSLIALKSELAGRLTEQDPVRARAEMADVEAAARRALAEVREAVSGYRSVGLSQALAEARSALGGAGIAVTAPRALPSLPAEVDVVLGWVVREATTNVLRHSEAGSVDVRVRTEGTEVVVSVEDDGHGGRGGAPAGAGIAGLTERVESIGGSLSAGPAQPTGFRLAVTVPCTLSEHRVVPA